jgi:hypothetical protein
MCQWNVRDGLRQHAPVQWRLLFGLDQRSVRIRLHESPDVWWWRHDGRVRMHASSDLSGGAELRDGLGRVWRHDQLRHMRFYGCVL